jgi:hypothetical protein
MKSETEMNHKRQRDFFKESATSKRASRHRLPFMLHPNITPLLKLGQTFPVGPHHPVPL